MSDENKNNGSNPENASSDKAKELIEKGKEFADKAEDFFSEKIKEFKNSNTFGKISDAFGKVEEIMEDKSQEFHSGEMSAKFDAFKEKAEVEASDLLKKAKETGRKIGDQLDDTIDAFKGKKGSPGNQNGGGI